MSLQATDPPNQAPAGKAVFLDRDGVINSNEGRYYIWKKEDLEINPGVIETLKTLKKRGFMLFVITNQGGISRGQYNREDVEILHGHLNSLLEKEVAAVDEFYYCPHHSDHENCLCRKPQPLMIQKAMARYGIDVRQSWMIGDALRDVEAGEAAGLQCILVEANRNLQEILDKIH